MLVNNRSMSLGKDGLTNPAGDVVPNIGSPLQAGCPVLPRGDPDMLLKVLFPLNIPEIRILFRLCFFASILDGNKFLTFKVLTLVPHWWAKESTRQIYRYNAT